MATEGARTAAFSRNPELEALLDQLSAAIGPGGDRLAARHRAPRHPLILVVGCPRSGSTLAMQWLAASGCLAVPSNLISRFYRAPAIGALVQRLLFDPALDFRGELAVEAPGPGFDSALGKTRGALSPNEFWYFWRRFFRFGRDARLDDDALSEVDGARLVSELAALESVLAKPLAMKALLMDWHLPLLASLLEGALFLRVTRHPAHTIQSLLSARRAFTGAEDGWYSLRPPGWERITHRPPVEQVAWQVHQIRAAVEAGLQAVEPDRQQVLAYEDLCADPTAAWERLVLALDRLGCSLDPTYRGPRSFTSANRLDPARAEAIHAAWRAVEDGP